MKYKLIIFDFDGTIADTSEGILDSHRYTLNVMGKKVPSDDVLFGVIGGALLRIYMERFDFPENQAREALEIYRKRYAEVGIHKAYLYRGFRETVSELKRQGYKIGVATLKAERFATCMLEELGIKEFFDVICGMDDDDENDKASLVKKCCVLCDVGKHEAILVGDSNSDANGSREAGVDFVGVTYGFGFKSNVKYDFDTINYIEELIDYLQH